MIHNHEVRSSILRPATRKHSFLLCFFVYTIRPRPEGAWTLAFMELRACFQGDRNDNGQTGREATGGLVVTHNEISQRSAPGFLGYHATGHKGLEGALRATETSCVPLLHWKSTTYKEICEWFFLSVNTAWTPNLFISFSFHYFHTWLVERSKWMIF